MNAAEIKRTMQFLADPHTIRDGLNDEYPIYSWEEWASICRMVMHLEAMTIQGWGQVV